MGRLRDNLTYANVMSTICFFLLVSGGAAYAASHLGKNSVGAKQLQKNAVTDAKIKNQAVTAAKVKSASLTGQQVADESLTGKQVKASTLGTVPVADRANSVAAPEAWREVGAPGQPQFENGWANKGEENETVGFYKDQQGIVHLKGTASGGSSTTPIFELPPGYRPAAHLLLQIPVVCGGCAGGPVYRIGIYGPQRNTRIQQQGLRLRGLADRA